MLVAVLFALQVYLDFAAYSEIAIGAAQVMGIKLMQNFKRPFLATSLSDLWQRWHVSLVSWLRDYIYLPLSSRNDSAFKRSCNMILIFLLSGLWHGANWTFVLWGFLNGVFLVVENFTKEQRKLVYERFVPNLKLRAIIKNIITLLLFGIIGIFFRASNLDQGFEMIVSIFDLQSYNFDFDIKHQKLLLFCSLLVVLMMGFEHMEERHSFESIMIKTPLVLRWFSYCVILLSIIAFIPQESQNFIYFQF